MRPDIPWRNIQEISRETKLTSRSSPSKQSRQGRGWGLSLIISLVVTVIGGIALLLLEYKVFKTSEILNPTEAFIAPSAIPATEQPTVGLRSTITPLLPTDTVKPTSTNTFKPFSNTASIVFPYDGAIVSEWVTVTGMISGLTPDQHAFLCVQSQAYSQRIYPQGQIFPDATSQWAVEARYASSRYTYTTFVVVTSSSAAQILADENSRKNGLPNLPPSTFVISPAIYVTRN